MKAQAQSFAHALPMVRIHDRELQFITNFSGSRRIAVRAPGLKDWLADNTPGITYRTAMHYKKLPMRLR